MIKEEQLAAYNEMAKNASANGMETQIRENLLKTCDKFAGNEDKFDRCIEYLTECAREIRNGKNGDVPDEVCFRICRDYFNDEIWKKEDEEKAEREAKAKERTDRAAAKKAAAEAKKAEEAKKKAEAAEAKKKAEAAEAKKKAEEEAKKAEPENEKFPICRVCGKEFINLYKDGMCADCYEKKPMQAEKSDPAHAAKIQPEPGQLDFFAAMGV